MSISHNPLDKIHALEEIEREITACLQSAGLALQELAKEKPSQKNVETQTHQFLKSLSSIETKLGDQINYLAQVSTGLPHEGSGYGSAKVLQMAWHRIQHVKYRVRELEEFKTKSIHALRLQQQRIATAQATRAPNQQSLSQSGSQDGSVPQVVEAQNIGN